MAHPGKILEELGLSAQKRFGQNFLVSPHWTEKLTDPILEFKRLDEIWEIGPGLGALTEKLLKRSTVPVRVFEVDRGLIENLRNRFPNLDIIEGDVLESDLAERCQGKQIGLVSNLPYNISSPIFFLLLENRVHFPRLVLTFQKELSERLAAAPGSKVYGGTSVLAQTYFTLQKIGNLPQDAFFPKPQVVSQALMLDRKEEPAVDEKKFRDLIRLAFGHRRKKLLNNVRTQFPSIAEALGQIGVDPDTRAESLSPENWLALAKALEGFEKSGFGGTKEPA